MARALFPDVLPYVVGTPATYGFAGFNGRTLADNAPEAMLSLVLNTAVPAGLKPSVAKDLRDDNFPYVVPTSRLVGARGLVGPAASDGARRSGSQARPRPGQTRLRRTSERL